jgi:putative membrane protein
MSRPPDSAVPTTPPDAGQLAVDRTRLAHERTLLAWVRTATGLITFGFSVYKFFEIQHATLGIAAHKRLLGAREFAILSIIMGLVALLLATIEHTRNIRALRAQGVRVPHSLAGVFAGLISLFGLAGLFAAIFRQ